MRAIVVSRRGGPEVLAVAETAAPRPGPGEIVADVAAAGVNFLDIYHRTGHYQKALPFTPGVEGCGTVVATGPGVTEVAAGDRVCWVLHPGSYAEQIVIPTSRVVRIPDAAPNVAVAAGLLHGMAARYLTTSTYQVGPGDTVLVQAATGGMRLLVAQLAKARGARVIATVGTPGEMPVARAAGADDVLCYQHRDLAAQVRQLTGGAGVDVVYEALGRAGVEVGLACLRPRGTLAMITELSGPVTALDPAKLSAGSFFFTRPVLAHHVSRRRDLEESVGDVVRWLSDGTLRPRIGRCYPLSDSASAHRALEERRDTGKPVIQPRALPARTCQRKDLYDHISGGTAAARPAAVGIGSSGRPDPRPPDPSVYSRRRPGGGGPPVRSPRR
jgi:NADPH:quinone reductase